MRAKSFSFLIAMVWLLEMIALITIFGCGNGEVNTPTHVMEVPSTTSVEVQTFNRSKGTAPGMDVVVSVHEQGVGVDSVRVQYEGDVGDGVYSDLCCAWYRVEDMWGCTWGGLPSTSALSIKAPANSAILTQGTWIMHIYYMGDVAPVVKSVSFTERRFK